MKLTLFFRFHLSIYLKGCNLLVEDDPFIIKTFLLLGPNFYVFYIFCIDELLVNLLNALWVWLFILFILFILLIFIELELSLRVRFDGLFYLLFYYVNCVGILLYESLILSIKLVEYFILFFIYYGCIYNYYFSKYFLLPTLFT